MLLVLSMVKMTTDYVHELASFEFRCKNYTIYYACKIGLKPILCKLSIS